MSLSRSFALSNKHASGIPGRRCVLLGDRQQSYSSHPPPRENGAAPSNNNESASGEAKEEGALSRRLSEMTEDALLGGGRSARKNIEAAGFSDDLKAQLEEKIKMSTFKSENAGAFSVANIPVCSIRNKLTRRVLIATGKRRKRHTRYCRCGAVARDRKYSRHRIADARR